MGPQPQSAGSFPKRRIRSPTVTEGVQPRPLRCRLAPDSAPDSATAVQAALGFQPFPFSRRLSEPAVPGRKVEGEGRRRQSRDWRSGAPGKCLNNRTDAAAQVSPGCWKVGCCNWSCPLWLLGAERSQTKRPRPAPPESPAGPRDVPLSPQYSCSPRRARQLRLAPRSLGAPIPRRRRLLLLFLTTVCGSLSRRLLQPPPSRRSANK